jgi:hypothetical protein
MPLLNNLLEFPLYCIYVIKDDLNNASLHWSNGNAIDQLALIVTDLRRGIHSNKLLQNAYNRNALSLEVLKMYDSPQSDITIRADAVLLFQQTSYLDMTGKYNNIQYKVYKTIMADYRDLLRRMPLVYVTIKCTSIGAIVVGIFDNMIEADEWLSKTYPGQVNALRYCDNELTKVYHKTKGYKLIRFRESR